MNRLNEIGGRIRGQGGGNESVLIEAFKRENLSVSELRDLALMSGFKAPSTLRSKEGLHLYLAQVYAQHARRTGNY